MSTGGKPIRICVTVVLAGLLAACGGAQSRLASHMRHGRVYFDQGDYARAGVEFRNAMQIAPRDPNAKLMAARTAEGLKRPRDAVALYAAVIEIDPDNIEARARQGRLFALGGLPERAIAVIAPGLAKHPESAELLTYKAAAELQLKKSAEAVADADHALRLAPTNEDTIALRAGIYRSAGDYGAATVLLERAVQQLPNSKSLHQILASVYEDAGHPDKTEQQLRILIALDPRNLEYRSDLASLYLHAHRVDDAQRVLEDAVKAIPNNDGPKFVLVDFETALRGRAQAEQVLRRFIAAAPDDLDLRLGLGAWQQGGGANADAQATYAEVAKRDENGPKGLTARNRLAAIALSRSDYASARRYVEQVLNTNPHDDSALALRGQISLATGDAASAITDLRAVLKDLPQSAGVLRALSQAYQLHHDDTLAKQSLRSALEIEPTNLPTRLELARLLVQGHEGAEAVKVLQDGLDKSASDASLWEAMVHAQLAAGDLPAALAATNELTRLRPDSPSGPYLAGLIAQAQKRFGDASAEFEKALQLQPTFFDALEALARLHLLNGEVPQAVAVAKSALERDPNNARDYDLLGQLYLGQHNPTLAIEALTKATQLSPKSGMFLRNLALAKYAAKNTPGAISDYQEAIKVTPDDPFLVTELVSVYQSLGRIDDAIQAYDTWQRSHPGNRIVANNLSVLLVTYRTDRVSLDRARELTAGFESSNDGNLLDTLGWVHYKRAEYLDALPLLQHAVDQIPASNEIRYHLGMAEMRAGQADQARKDLEAAVSGTAAFKGAEDARTALASLKGRTG